MSSLAFNLGLGGHCISKYSVERSCIFLPQRFYLSKDVSPSSPVRRDRSLIRNLTRTVFRLLGASNGFPIFSVKIIACTHSTDSMKSRHIGGV